MTKLLSLIAAASAIVLSANSQALDVDAKFKSACAACHMPPTNAALGSPEAFNPESWAPRLEKGMDALVSSVTNGKGAMPPGGLCSDCSAEDYKALITYMSSPK